MGLGIAAFGVDVQNAGIADAEAAPCHIQGLPRGVCGGALGHVLAGVVATGGRTGRPETTTIRQTDAPFGYSTSTSTTSLSSCAVAEMVPTSRMARPSPALAVTPFTSNRPLAGTR